MGARFGSGRRRAVLRRAVRRSRDRLRGWRLDRLHGRGRAPIVYGNRAALLDGGERAFAAIEERIAAATTSVAIEMYTWADDRIGRRLADRCAERARAGVPVYVLLDAFGSLRSGAIAQRIEKAGARVLWYHALLPWAGRRWGWNRRNHRKLVIVDGVTGFAGGVNVAEDYSAEFSGAFAWRDLAVRIDGPGVREMTRVFLLSWIEAGGAADDTAPLIATSPEDGAAGLQVMGGRGLLARRRLRGMHLQLLHLAHAEVFVANAYFVPERPLVRALVRTARRGVRVRLLLPGVSDSPPARWAARAFYGALLRAGVEIREVHDVVLHAKAAIVDGEVLLTGSANLDYRSFRHNLEVTVTVHDDSCARAAAAALETTWAGARPVTLEAWGSRGFADRLLEGLALLVRFWL